MNVRVLDQVRRFLADRSGNFAVMFALLTIPLFGMAGLAVDYLRYTIAQQRIESAASTAALTAINSARRLAQKNPNWGDPSFAMKEATQAGLRAFEGNVATLSGVSVAPANIRVISRNNNKFHAEVAWEASLPATFAALFGVTTLRLAGSAKAEAALTVYTTIHVVMDFSASMLIGADAADHALALKLTQEINPGDRNCAFLCHIQEPHWRRPTYPALKGRTRLRTDVMRDAVVRAIDDLQRVQVAPNEFRVGVYGFSNDVREFLPASDPRAGNLDHVRKIVMSTDVWPSSGGGSSFWRLFAYLDKVVPVAGLGSSPANPRQSVILITDAVENNVFFNSKGVNVRDNSQPSFAPTLTGNRLQNVDPAYCNNLKHRGVEIIVVRVRYMIPQAHTDWGGFPEIRNVLEPRMAETIGRCATNPSHYISADTPEQIATAIATSFRMVAPTRLTR